MNLQQAYYEQRFENQFLRCKGDEFQTFVERLMGLAYKGDFLACRPWGNIGDKKNDGFLRSDKRLYQVYAPNEMEAAKAIAKITEDFVGAIEHWGTHFENWSFVHNAIGGLPPHVHELLLRFEEENPGISLDSWGLEELRGIFRTLSPDDLASWLGLAPTDEAKARVGFSDIKLVLESLAGRTTSEPAVVKKVPPGKIEANALSESVGILIKNGLSKSHLISSFLDGWHDETLGERLADAFRRKYLELKGTEHPNQIFAELQTWVGGSELGTPEHQVAVLAALAYYFERCDIFEEPKAAAI